MCSTDRMTQSINGMSMSLSSTPAKQYKQVSNGAIMNVNFDEYGAHTHMYNTSLTIRFFSLSESEPMNYLAVALFMYATALVLSVELMSLSFHCSIHIEAKRVFRTNAPHRSRTYECSRHFIYVFIKHASD